jgi:hypothetical protein
MCRNSNVSNAGIYRVVVKTGALNAELKSRSITKEARLHPKINLKGMKWCNLCGDFTGREGGGCVECNKRLAAELASRDGTYPKACSCGWSDFITVGSNCPDCGNKLHWRDGR